MLDFIVLGQVPGISSALSFTGYLIIVFCLGLIALEILGTIPTPKILSRLESRFFASSLYSHLRIYVFIAKRNVRNIGVKIGLIEPKIIDKVSKISSVNLNKNIRLRVQTKHSEHTN